MISCGEVGRWAQALALYERMAAGGVRLEQRSFRLAMTSAMQLGRYETALHLTACSQQGARRGARHPPRGPNPQLSLSLTSSRQAPPLGPTLALPQPQGTR